MNSLRNLDARIHADGEIDLARACAERGTIVVTPTHSSNMDSPAIGLGLLRASLPPTTYGAGKNLFSNPFISFFMRNLGAYRVDRRLRFELYKDVLKEYSTVLLEHGYHSLFFPGGTRCRSNLVEKQLKLGLLGTTVTAYKNSVREGAPHKRIYIVPATINYRLVLEAETLIDDYLAETGKNRYIITDDEFNRIGRLLEFFRKILVHEGSVVVRFGRPLDPFGNDITDDGESIDRAGRAVDPASFVRGADGEVSDDDQRDAEYTRALGRRLAAAYPRLTVFHSTTLVARVLYDAISQNAGTRDIYRLLRAPQGHLEVPVDAAVAGLERLRARIAREPAHGSEHPLHRDQPSSAKLDDAIRGLATYHTRPIVERTGQDNGLLQVKDVKLLYYYQNRTAHIPPEGAS
jgi:glycerol-3-phosphate O-acyltransferase